MNIKSLNTYVANESNTSRKSQAAFSYLETKSIDHQTRRGGVQVHPRAPKLSLPHRVLVVSSTQVDVSSR